MKAKARATPTACRRLAAAVTHVAAAGALLLSCPAAHARDTSPQHGRGFEGTEQVLDLVTRGIEFAGIAVIVGGALLTTGLFALRFARGDVRGDSFHRYRSGLGRAILLGLEFLVAADIIGTVAIRPSIESVLVLGGIVLIRTFLSFSLEVEIEGRLPWRRSADAAPAQEPRA